MVVDSIGILPDFDSDGIVPGVDSDPLEFATKTTAIDNQSTVASSCLMLGHVVM